VGEELKDGNGWKVWMLTIAGVIICGLVALLVSVIWRAYDHISDDHQRMFEKIQKLEMKRGDK
jgi:hypothetical protein